MSILSRAIIILVLLAVSTLARSDGIYNPGSRGIGFTDGIFNGGEAPAPPSCIPGAPTGEMDFSVCSNIAITAALW